MNKNQLENGIQLLTIELSHISHLAQLPSHHNDPFDHLLIAQAIIEDMTIVTADTSKSSRGTKPVWIFSG